MDIATPPPARICTTLDPAFVAGARIVLCDLDGCLIAEGRAFADAAEFVRGCGNRLWIISNRSDTTARDLSRFLATLALPVPEERILLAGEIALEHLARTRAAARLRLHATEALAARAAALGLETADAAPDTVLLCRDPAVNVDHLGALLADVSRGAELWISNEDLSHPGHDGHPVAETGALLAALRAIRPELTWISPGKPDPLMLLSALQRSGLSPPDAIFVGDNPLTDGLAATAAGIAFLHLQRSASA